MATWVTALSVLLIVCLGDFSALGADTQDNAEQLVKEVDTKIDDSIETLKQFFQSTKRDVGDRAKRSWWRRNRNWIVPVASKLLLGRDVSAEASQYPATADKTIPAGEVSLDKVNEAVEFLQNIVNTAAKVTRTLKK